MKFYWRGRNWVIRAATKEELLVMDDSKGMLFSDKGLILYDGAGSEDIQIMTILHELGHEMFPEWKTEPTDDSKSELGVFERDMKSLCDEIGIDLSPLLGIEEGECTDTVSS